MNPDDQNNVTQQKLNLGVHEWEGRFAQQTRLIQLLVIGCIISVIGNAISIFGYYHFVQKNYRFVPFVVEVDKLGETRLSQSPQKLGEWPVTVIRREVSNYIQYMRSIPADREVMLRDYQRLAAFTVPSSSALRKLDEINTLPNSPAKRQETETNFVRIVSVTRVSDKTWDARWVETSRNKSTGSIISTRNYKGNFVLRSVTAAGPEDLSVNPLGFGVLDFDIQEIRQ